MMKVKEWVETYCDTCDDATSLRIMRGQAYGEAFDNIEILDAIPSDDFWVVSVITSRDAMFDCIDRIEARMTALGVTWDNTRSYGMNEGMCRRVDLERAKRNG